jgi:hypothetical protein
MDLDRIANVASDIMGKAIKNMIEVPLPAADTELPLPAAVVELIQNLNDICDDARLLWHYALLSDRESIREHFHKSYKMKCGRWQGVGELAKELENVYIAAGVDI